MTWTAGSRRGEMHKINILVLLTLRFTVGGCGGSFEDQGSL